MLAVLDTGYSPGGASHDGGNGHWRFFDQGSEQIRLVAGLEVTWKGPRTACRAIASDIVPREQIEIQRGVRLDHGQNGDVLTRTREVKRGCVFTQTTT
jgi:hypothetical protein